MKKHRPLLILLWVVLCLCLSSCSVELPPFSDGASAESLPTSPYDGEITFEGRRYSYRGSSENITAEGDRLIIKKSGSYLLTGELSEGRIYVDCGGTVRLCLGGVSLSSTMGAVIEQGGGELTIETLSDSINYLTASVCESDGVLPSGAVCASGDVRFTGDGSLVVNAKCTGIAVGGRIYMDGGALTLSSGEYGLWARDKIKLSGGNLTLTYAKTGLCAYGGEYSLGLVEITGGSFVALCEDTAVFAGREISITGGSGDIRAKALYKCERDVDGKPEKGLINITSEDFPKSQN